ncbi:hypothetical protein [Microvirga antarctica]|uniref:hypothetical protein n=1 Tax=Microvirga antarctica TaxID=2819233 RepID=UPI001B3031FC|nr:hypothetical protein [Microvirga antarctica]
MTGDVSEANHADVVSVLLHPSLVPVMDVFRGRAAFGSDDRARAIELAELRLQSWTSPEHAENIVVHALLLASALDWPELPTDRRKTGSRHTTVQDRRLISLVADPDTSSRQAPLAQSLADALESAGLVWPHVVLPEGSATLPLSAQTDPIRSADDAAFTFKV